MKTEHVNWGRDLKWTCPSCEADLPHKATGKVSCPSCGARLKLFLVSQPGCMAVLADAKAGELGA